MQIIIHILEMHDLLDFAMGTTELFPTMQIENSELRTDFARLDALPDLFARFRSVEDHPSLERLVEVEEPVGNSRGDEEEISWPEGNRVVSHPETALPVEDHIALVPVVGQLGVSADRGVEPHFELAAVQGNEVAVGGELGGAFRRGELPAFVSLH